MYWKKLSNEACIIFFDGEMKLVYMCKQNQILAINKTKTKNKMRPDQCWCSTLKTQQTTSQIKTNKFKENRKSDTCIPDLRDKKRRKKRRGSLAMVGWLVDNVMMPCLQPCTNVSTAILFSGSAVNEKLNDI